MLYKSDKNPTHQCFKIYTIKYTIIKYIYTHIFGRLFCTAGMTVCDEKCCHRDKNSDLWRVSELSLQSFQMSGLTIAPYHDSVFPEEFTSGYIGTALNFVSDCHMLCVPARWHKVYCHS